MPLKLPFKATIAGIALLTGALLAGENSGVNPVFLARAQGAYAQAWQTYQADTNSTVAAWQFGRASFGLAELTTNDAQRANVARQGIRACRQLVNREPTNAPGHYYLAMNLGQLAKAKAPSIAAYKLVHEVEREFTTAAKLDVQLDHAGPARTLGLLYFQAPGWPFSIGNDDKAREWLERAASLAPDYPGNQLVLAEAQLKWRQRDELAATLKKLDALWPAARTNLTGVDWEQTWQEWDTRRAAVQAGWRRIYGNEP